MSMVCYLSSFAESKKHSIRLYVRRRSLTSSPKILVFLSPRSALQSQIEQKFISIPYQTPPFNAYGFVHVTLRSAMSTASVPSQPLLSEAYKQPLNPASKNPSEANPSHSISGPKVETRKLNDVTVEATPTALGYGVRDSSGDRGDEVLRNMY